MFGGIDTFLSIQQLGKALKLTFRVYVRVCVRVCASRLFSRSLSSPRSLSLRLLWLVSSVPFWHVPSSS